MIHLGEVSASLEWVLVTVVPLLASLGRFTSDRDQ